MIEYGRKIEEKMKAMQSEIKKNVQGTNSDGRETGTQINNLEQKEEINIQPEQNEETGIQKNEERLRNLWDNFKCFSIWIFGVPEGEEEEQEQEIENLFENIIKDKRVPKKLDPRKHTPRHIIITLLKIKKQQEKRTQLPTKEFP